MSEGTGVHRRIVVVALEHAPGAVWANEQLATVIATSPPGRPPEQRASVADFWADCTLGLASLDLVDVRRVQLPAEDLAWQCARSGQSHHDLEPLVTALAGYGAVPMEADMVLVVASLPAGREYAARVRVGDRTIAAAYVDVVRSTHSVFCHEVGHMLGFVHSWGLHSMAGGRPGPEYGSPYCLMGRAFRDHHVSTVLPPMPGGPPPGAPFWAHAGPRLSLAELLAWTRRTGQWSGALGRRLSLRDHSGVDVLLSDRPGPERSLLAFVEFLGTRDVLVLELRRGVSWSAFPWDVRLALERDVDTDRYDSPAVVVHRLQDVRLDLALGARRAVTGPARPEDDLLPDRAWFVGSIPVPPSGDRDLHVTGTTAAEVELLSFDERAGLAHVQVRPAHKEEDWFGRPRRRRSVQLRVVPSGPGAPAVRISATSVGYDFVTFEWQVDGQVVGRGRLGQPVLASEVVLRSRTRARERRVVRGTSAPVRLSWDELDLAVPAGSGNAAVRVKVTALEDGPDPHPSTARTTVLLPDRGSSRAGRAARAWAWLRGR